MIFDRFAPLAALLPSAVPFAEVRTLLARYLDPDSFEGRRLRAHPFGTSERVPLAGGLYALENVYLPKDEADCPFEAHRIHADLQAVVEGSEFIDAVECAALEETVPYDASRDIAFYAPRPPLARLRLDAGFAALLLPRDAHRPGVRTGPSPAPVRKVVFKIPAELLRDHGII